jgi:pimeloyl-ACP methyl ester carboxylesterase
MHRRVVFSHGKESGPWGSKISALAERATRRHWVVDSVDYRGIDDPHARVSRLLATDLGSPGVLILVGSSMGGHVAAAASKALGSAGLFLMAPAFYMPGFEAATPVPAAAPVTIVHGWNDEVVPVENSIRYARAYGATLHLLDTDHRMNDRIEEIGGQFELFLSTYDGKAGSC